MRLLLASALAVLATPALADGHMSGSDGTLSLERVFASPSLNGAVPRGAKLSPDGQFLTLLRNRETDSERYDLWGYEIATGEWRMLVDSEKLGSGRELSEDEKMQRERARVGNLKGIITYQWSSDGSGVLVPLDGDLYFARLDGTVTRLTDTEESELNPKLSAKSGYVSFVRDRQLWVGKVGEEPAPISPKEGPLIRWGEAEFVAQEEMSRLTGYWWEPNDLRIAVQRTDESPVGVVTRAAIGATGTKVFDQRYPVAGSDNALVELFIMDPDGSNRVKVDLGEETDIYVVRVDWGPDDFLYVQRQNREQTVLDMLKVDPTTGASEVWFTETAAREDYWINLSDNYRFLKDGTLLWWSERNGFGHFYRFDGETWTQLTFGDEPVTGLVGVNQETRRLYFTQTSDVLTQQVYETYLDAGTRATLLTDEGYTNSASMDKSGQQMIVYRSSPNQPTQSYLADTKGERLTWIEENRIEPGHPYEPYVLSHVTPEYGVIKAEDGTDLHYMVMLPKIEAGKKYPVFYYHYSGPGPQIVDRGWQGALAQAIVDKGYIYFALDGRGTANRGVDFEQPIYRAMGGVEVRDQKTGAEYLKTLEFVDADKIAIYGWSYGGYMTLKQLQADPGLYAAGISGAPVTRWGL
ncbi:MAG: DPP IV N-terminal domain-containing protein, partial [Pseudomonadota bacterium]